MELFYLIYIFILGLLIGSFLNVCIYRIPKGESIAFPGSHCYNCNSRLKSLDLVPVFSYLFLKGKCRYCGVKISPRYALIELLTALLFGAIYLKYGLTFKAIKFTIFTVFIIVIGFIDLDTTDVYSITTYSGIAVGIALIVIESFLGGDFKSYIFGALLGAGVITFIILTTKGMGWGDVEICGLCGLFLGFQNSLLMMLLSFIIGGVTGVGLILTKIKSRKDYVPFGPSIALAAIITMLFGDRIINWYLYTFILF